MFFKRSYQKELMDDFSINDERIGSALNELQIINKFLGGNSVSEDGINNIKRSLEETIKILDVGAGASDILFDLKNKIENIIFYSIDKSMYTCQYQKGERGNDKIICADAFRLPFINNSFGIVHSSLFLHHFAEKEILILLKEFSRIAKQGIIINDLRRNILAYSGIKILTLLFSKSEFVKSDGPLSVKRAFVKNDLKKILMKAGIAKYIIKRKWAFRFLIVIPLDENGL